MSKDRQTSQDSEKTRPGPGCPDEDDTAGVGSAEHCSGKQARSLPLLRAEVLIEQPTVLALAREIAGASGTGDDEADEPADTAGPASAAERSRRCRDRALDEQGIKQISVRIPASDSARTVIRDIAEELRNGTILPEDLLVFNGTEHQNRALGRCRKILLKRGARAAVLRLVAWLLSPNAS